MQHSIDVTLLVKFKSVKKTWETVSNNAEIITELLQNNHIKEFIMLICNDKDTTYYYFNLLFDGVL